MDGLPGRADPCGGERPRTGRVYGECRLVSLRDGREDELLGRLPGRGGVIRSLWVQPFGPDHAHRCRYRRLPARNRDIQPLLPACGRGKTQHGFGVRRDGQRASRGQRQRTGLFRTPHPNIHHSGLRRRIGHDQLLGGAGLRVRQHERLLQRTDIAECRGQAAQVALRRPGRHGRGSADARGRFQQLRVEQQRRTVDVGRGCDDFRGIRRVEVLELRGIAGAAKRAELRPVHRSERGESGRRRDVAFTRLIFAVTVRRRIRQCHAGRAVCGDPPLAHRVRDGRRIRRDGVDPTARCRQYQQGDEQADDDHRGNDADHSLPDLASAFDLAAHWSSSMKRRWLRGNATTQYSPITTPMHTSHAYR